MLFRALDAEGLAREVQIPFPRGAEEADDVEKVGVRLQGVAIADEVLGHRDAERGAAQHEERPVEAPAVERHEALESRDRLPELLQEDRLGVADEPEQAVRRDFLDAPVGLFVPDAAAARLRVDHREHDDAPGQRPEREELRKLLSLLVRVRIPLQVGSLRVVERFPLDAHRLDVEDNARHGSVDAIL